MKTTNQLSMKMERIKTEIRLSGLPNRLFLTWAKY
nr:MAG TPA: hypothetical protein [Caudoviricetes sp.]DAO23705.1 MAG TPA: hypothetical protein [Caudoviricetes sp.]DAS26291.1 MAG TPA: hypothetical protein [Caudoviricetes sp.]DAU91324.1 MAG TPA: hypothetical protein [Bacteriophage sp.]DAX58346.1 MAG TPA: hypothetical protein [Caudoviricetes sp.]